MIVFFLAILFLVLAIFAETFDEWTLGAGPVRPSERSLVVSWTDGTSPPIGEKPVVC